MIDEYPELQKVLLQFRHVQPQARICGRLKYHLAIHVFNKDPTS